MSDLLRQHARDYLNLRLDRGYRPCDAPWVIRNYLNHLDEQGSTRITIADALAWSCLPEHVSLAWHNERLGIIRSFATYVRAIDSDAADLIPTRLIPSKRNRVTPYLYTPEQITALMSRAEALQPALRGHTLATILGLMAATGIRTAEALALNTEHVDTDQYTILIHGKGGAQRLLPVHRCTIAALNRYRASVNHHLRSPQGDGAFFRDPDGKRPVANTVQQTFRAVASACGLGAIQPGGRLPRMYDLRHSFAVNTLIDAHHTRADVDQRVATLATYLGHRSTAYTYWYLTASPELLHLVADRIETHFQKGQS